MTRRRAGHTLIEALVATALFLIFVIVSGSLIVEMLRAYSEGEARVRPLQQARNAMTLMSSTWRNVSGVIQPDEQQLSLGSDQVVLSLYNPDGSVRGVAFYRTPDQSLMMDDYPIGYPSEPHYTRKLLQSVPRLKFRRNPGDSVVYIELVTVLGGATKTEMTLTTLVGIRTRY